MTEGIVVAAFAFHCISLSTGYILKYSPDWLVVKLSLTFIQVIEIFSDKRPKFN